jgi:hypothetical protein
LPTADLPHKASPTARAAMVTSHRKSIAEAPAAAGLPTATDTGSFQLWSPTTAVMVCAPLVAFHWNWVL